MTTVLLTGASGALGRAVLQRLQGRPGYRVVAAGRQQQPAGQQESVVLDLRNAAQTAEVLAQVAPDWIVHLAASFSADFDEAYAINVEATRQLLEAVAASARPVRLLLCGSAAEYGIIEPDENPVREDHVLRPVSVYGMTKAWQTQLAGVYAARGVDVRVARVFNLDGPGLSERLFIGRLQAQIDAVLAGRQGTIELGPLGATRDYLTTDEAAEQLLAIAAHAPAASVHHVASGVGVTMRELMMRHLEASGLDVAIVREAAELSNRSGYDVPVIYADVSKTQDLIKQWRSGEKH